MKISFKAIGGVSALLWILASFPNSTVAESYGKHLQTGDSTFNHTVKKNEAWLKAERLRDAKARARAKEEARKSFAKSLSNPVQNSEPSTTDKTSKSKLSAGAKTSSAVLTIVKNGQSASGKTAYKITCPNGQVKRIWRVGNEWWDARGKQGGNSRNLQRQAEFLCA